jgi:hypothetical protein
MNRTQRAWHRASWLLLAVLLPAALLAGVASRP